MEPKWGHLRGSEELGGVEEPETMGFMFAI